MNEVNPVPSPCIGVCALDEQDVCIACRRTAIEIGEWGVMNNAQRIEVYDLIGERVRAEKLARDNNNESND
ncbi:DUF1289 domain-containing protein [Amphritea balenae]|uniref:DUF1289 domain-containing protein n=2 Tax=Amphritea balenae TaxID=452629 RepID=A0A3P1SR91_9GAMM|nr:DUF1289 domain-containing protein [Amphritea balenae]RRC98682.1 DUF1289 domain-containing protein [Amphritea balenae]